MNIRICFCAQPMSYSYHLTFAIQAARALANLAAHGESNNSCIAVGSEAGALEALVQLTRSAHNGVRCVCVCVFV